MDRVDEILRKLLAEKGSKARTGAVCPSDQELIQLGSGTLPLDVRDKLVDHTADCPDCTARLGAILALDEAPSRPESTDNVSKTRTQSMDRLPNVDPKSRLPGESTAQRWNAFKTQLAKHAWLVVSIAFLGLSFFVPRYFVQFIVLTILFGLKWVFDTATTRQMIMIYEAWKDKKEGQRK